MIAWRRAGTRNRDYERYDFIHVSQCTRSAAHDMGMLFAQADDA